MRRRRWIAVFSLVAVIALLAASWLGFWMAIRAFFYPFPPQMPPVVDKPTRELLEQLESVLRIRAPALAASLQPGLSDEAIAALEAEGGCQFTDDLRSLYSWHDGMIQKESRELIPGHRFLSLEEIVRQRAAVRQQQSAASWPQRSAYAVFAGHRDSWITIMDDVAGDGYFYDPGRKMSGGSFFYNFAEDGSYLYFPSFRNFVAAVIDCYDSNAFRPAPGGKRWEQNFEKATEVWLKFGATNP
jgi:cell wall assembly regulator SMI1